MPKKQRFVKTDLEERIDEYLDKKKVQAVYPDAYAVTHDGGRGVMVCRIFADRSPKAKALCDTTRAERFAWQTAARMLGTEVAK